jgi:hypothetical protein
MNVSNICSNIRNKRRALLQAMGVTLFYGLQSQPLLAQSSQDIDPAIAEALQRLPDRAKSGELGTLTVTNFPEGVLNRTNIVMGPGMRIFSTGNVIVLPGSLQNSPQPVLYRQDLMGQVIEAWILNDAEIVAMKRLRRMK